MALLYRRPDRFTVAHALQGRRVLLIERAGRRADDARPHRGLLVSVAWGPHDATGVAVVRPASGGIDQAISLSRVASIEPDEQ